MESEGRRRLAELGRRHSAAALAEKAGVSETSLTRAMKGEVQARGPMRIALERFWSIPRGLWDDPPAKAPVGPVSRRKTVAPAPAPRLSAGSSLDDDIARQRARLDQLLSDPKALTKEVDLVEKALDRALKLKAKIEKPADMTTMAILRSPQWASMMATLIEALRPYPGAYDALASALEKLP